MNSHFLIISADDFFRRNATRILKRRNISVVSAVNSDEAEYFLSSLVIHDILIDSKSMDIGPSVKKWLYSFITIEKVFCMSDISIDSEKILPAKTVQDVLQFF